VKLAVLQEFLNSGERLQVHCFALTRKRSVVRIHYRPLSSSLQTAV
jgi:hypothetical protein